MNIWSWFLHGDSSHPTRHGWGEGRAFEACISDSLHEHCHLSPFQSHNFLRPSGHWLCHFCPPNYCQPLLLLLSYSLTFCLGIMIKSFFLLTSPTPTHSHAHTHIIISKPVWSPPFLIPLCLSPFPSYLYLFIATAWKDPCLLSVPCFQSKSDILKEQLQCVPTVCKVMFKFLISMFPSWDSFIPRGHLIMSEVVLVGEPGEETSGIYW